MKTSINLFLVYSTKLLHLVQDPFGVLAIRSETWALLRFEENQGRILISQPSKLVTPSCIYCFDSLHPNFPLLWSGLAWGRKFHMHQYFPPLQTKPKTILQTNTTDNIWAYKSTLNTSYPFNRNNQGSSEVTSEAPPSHKNSQRSIPLYSADGRGTCVSGCGCEYSSAQKIYINSPISEARKQNWL